MPKFKISNATFLVIFKHCDLVAEPQKTEKRERIELRHFFSSSLKCVRYSMLIIIDWYSQSENLSNCTNVYHPLAVLPSHMSHTRIFQFPVVTFKTNKN